MSAELGRKTKHKSFQRTSVALVSALCALPVTAAANDFTAEKVMKEMTERDRINYLTGVVEGLAIARYMKDGKQKAGMECIYDWFYDDNKTIDVIYAAFGRYPTYPPGSVVDVLSKQKCGE